MLKPIHFETDGCRPGGHNVCAALLGSKAGCALHEWLCKHVLWLGCVSVVGNTIVVIITYMGKYSAIPIAGILLHVLPMLVGLCQRVSTVKSLLRIASVWYYSACISSGRIAEVLVFGPRFWTVNGEIDAFRKGGYCAWHVFTAVSYGILMPGMDAMPPDLIGQRFRVAFFAIAALYKSDFLSTENFRLSSLMTDT